MTARITPRRAATIGIALPLLIVLGMEPADAATIGNGSSVGTYTIDSTSSNFPPPCSVVYNYTYASGPGYTGTYDDGVGNIYTGPLTVALTAYKDAFYGPLAVVGFENPEGIYQDSQCTLVDVDGWRSKAAVTTTPAGQVECNYEGQYNRRATQATTWEMRGPCKIINGPSTLTREVHVGTLGECREIDLTDPQPEECDETNTWVAVSVL